MWGRWHQPVGYNAPANVTMHVLVTGAAVGRLPVFRDGQNSEFFITRNDPFQKVTLDITVANGRAVPTSIDIAPYRTFVAHCTERQNPKYCSRCEFDLAGDDGARYTPGSGPFSFACAQMQPGKRVKATMTGNITAEHTSRQLVEARLR